MASSALSTHDICSNCGATLSTVLRNCPTCASDAGAPNVRACHTDENINALIARYEDSLARASERGYSNEFNELESLVKAKSGVVVAMNSLMARNLVDDPNFVYLNYEKLVGSKVRKPANSSNDRHRTGVGGILFGSYADSIIYGVLSLTEEGLPTYGVVYCRLRSVTIDKRTSFLEKNSYSFVEEHDIKPGGNIPDGYRACWKYRHNLVLAKMANHFSTGQTESDWQAILIQSDGKERMNDNFVEAHIFESFDINAIESMIANKTNKLNRTEILDFDIAISKFKARQGKTK